MRDFEKFLGKNEFYTKYRPSYPAACLDFLSKDLGIKGHFVADIGSGTGILARQLAPFAKEVFAVEPNEDMRRSLREQSIGFPNIKIIAGMAENSRLQDNSVDFVCAAQAFHWFDENAFKAECQRILSPGGQVLLLWNLLDDKASAIIKINQLCEQLGIPYRKVSLDLFTREKDFSLFFRNGAFKKKIFPNNVSLNQEAFIGRRLSSSYAPREGENNFTPYIEGLKKIFFQNQDSGGHLVDSYKTLLVYGEV